MRRVTQIVIHCSASPDGQSLFGEGVTPVQRIDRWHAERGFARSPEWRRQMNPDLMSIGYHLVIYLSGAIATGRHFEEIGAHVAGHNQQSIGICLLGTERFSAEQWASLATVVELLGAKYPGVEVLGHRDFPNVKKTCPGFDVRAWLARGMTPDPAHLLESAHA